MKTSAKDIYADGKPLKLIQKKKKKFVDLFHLFIFFLFGSI